MARFSQRIPATSPWPNSKKRKHLPRAAPLASSAEATTLLLENGEPIRILSERPQPFLLSPWRTIPMDRDNSVRQLVARDGPWDMAVIGGGATGVGIAVDAASRG